MKKGFTLIELLVSIAVIGILLTIGYKGYTAITARAKASQLADQLGQIKAGLAKYYKDMGTFPYNLKFLMEAPTQNDYCGIDAISVAMNGSGSNNNSSNSNSNSGSCPDDPELINYWGGPYINGMVMSPDSPGCIKAKVGGAICIGAAIKSNADFDTSKGAPGKFIAMPGVPNGTILQLEKSHSNAGTTAYYNVLQVNRITKTIAKYLVQDLNGNNPPVGGNLQTVATAGTNVYSSDTNVTQIVGVPADNIYSKYDRLIYRYHREF